MPMMNISIVDSFSVEEHLDLLAQGEAFLREQRRFGAVASERDMARRCSAW
jgi:hypothetical protein